MYLLGCAVRRQIVWQHAFSCGAIPSSATSPPAMWPLALALALGLPALAATTSPGHNSYQSFPNAIYRGGDNNRPRTRNDRTPNGWFRSLRPTGSIGFVSRPPPSTTSDSAGRQGRGRNGRVAGVWGGAAGIVRRPRPWGGRSLVVVNSGSGETAYYSWTETATDVEVRVPLPPGTPAKNVQLSVTKSSLTLGLKGREGPVLKGSLKGDVQADVSHWTMEEMEDTGEKMLYLCLEKAFDMESLGEGSMPGDWEGVLQGEDAVNTYYPDKDKDFDVNDYVKKMGYDRERDIDKVDKSMFSSLTEEMRSNLETKLPKTAFTEKDEMIPVVADPKVSPVIDTGVLGVQVPPSPEPEHVTVGETVGGIGSPTSAEAEVVRDDDVGAEIAAGLAADGAAGSSPGVPKPADFGDFGDPVREEESRSTGELTARQREVAAGLKDTYDKLVKRGMLPDQLNPDGTRMEMPDMDELARMYDAEGFMFKEGDFSEEELSKYAASMIEGLDDIPPGAAGLDMNDPAVRAAFGLGEEP